MVLLTQVGLVGFFDLLIVLIGNLKEGSILFDIFCSVQSLEVLDRNEKRVFFDFFSDIR